MSESTETAPVEQATFEELTEMIAELAQYRDRLVNETLAMAQKAKIMKAQALSHLEPSLAEIDLQIQGLRQQQEILNSK